MNKSLILLIGILFIMLLIIPIILAENQKVDFTISTHPQGAQVSITSERGTKSGTTPVTFKVLPDSYTVQITDSQGRAHVSTVNVGENGKVLTLELEPSTEEPANNEKVEFTISTHPQGAQVSITSERGTKSGTTPVTFKVLPDSYTVQITDSQGRAHVSTVNVGDDGKLLTLELEPTSQPTIPEATLTFEEQLAEAVFLETNAIRLENGLSPLQRNENMDPIAQTHAIYMASINDSNHDNVDERVDQINELGYGWVAENCVPARSGTQYDYCDHETHTVPDTPEGIAEFAVNTLVDHDWCEPMNNGHRTNILNSHYTDIGIGVAKGDSYYYIAQDFGGT